MRDDLFSIVLDGPDFSGAVVARDGLSVEIPYNDGAVGDAGGDADGGVDAETDARTESEPSEEVGRL